MLQQFLNIIFMGYLGTSGDWLLVSIAFWGLTWGLYWHLTIRSYTGIKQYAFSLMALSLHCGIQHFLLSVGM